MISNDNPERHPKSLSEDSLQLHPLIDLFEAGGKGLLGKIYLNP